MHGAQGKGAKRLLRRIKAPDIVCALLDEPDGALCIYGGRHEAIFRVGGVPGRDHSRPGIETSKTIGIHLADPDVSSRIYGWLHQANVRAWKRIDACLGWAHGHRGTGDGCSSRCACRRPSNRSGPRLCGEGDDGTDPEQQHNQYRPSITFAAGRPASPSPLRVGSSRGYQVNALRLMMFFARFSGLTSSAYHTVTSSVILLASLTIDTSTIDNCTTCCSPKPTYSPSPRAASREGSASMFMYVLVACLVPGV